MQDVVQHVVEKTKPLQPADFRPIANIRLLYKTFAYLLLGRLEQFLEAGQPEEQHGFRPGRRQEEHLVTANLVLDKADAVGIPVWIISLDLSKAFDRVHWPALWTALVDEGIPVHLEDAAGVGEWGSGPRNTRGDAMVSWVLGNGFNVCSRQTSLHLAHESWTCQRSMDGVRVQLDYILADGHVTVQQVWHDYIIPIGMTETCDLATECWSKVVGLYVGSRRVTITTHRSGLSSAASIEIFLRKPLDFIGPKRFHFQTLEIFQCRGLICRMLW